MLKISKGLSAAVNQRSEPPPPPPPNKHTQKYEHTSKGQLNSTPTLETKQLATLTPLIPGVNSDGSEG